MAPPPMNMLLSEDAHHHPYILLQASEAVLLALSAGSQTVSFRRRPSGAAVLCTERMSYDVRKIPFGGTRLLVATSAAALAEAADVGTTLRIEAIPESCLALSPAPPALDELYWSLAEHAIDLASDGAAPESDDRAIAAPMGEALGMATDEVIAAARALHAVAIGGVFRLLAPRLRALSTIEVVHAILRHGLDPTDFDLDRLAARFPADLAGIAAHAIDIACENLGGRRGRLRDGVVARAVATSLLLAGPEAARQDTRPTRADFFRILDQQLNLLGMPRPTEQTLCGVAVVGTIDGCVHYLPADAPPFDMARRLSRLFSVRARWRIEELRPYFAFLGDAAADIEATIARHTRIVVEGGVKFWVKRR